MKQSLQTMIKIILLAIIGITLFFFFLPVSTVIPKDILHPPVKKDNNNKNDVETSEITLNNPDNIAVLFGYVIPTPTPAPRITPRPTLTPVPTPIPARWLKHTGYAVLEEVKYYLFIDQRNNTPVKIAKGVPDKGWYFIKETSNGFLLKKDGIEYSVIRTR